MSNRETEVEDEEKGRELGKVDRITWKIKRLYFGDVIDGGSILYEKGIYTCS